MSMTKVDAIITNAIMAATGRADLTWVGLLKEVHNSYPDIKNVFGIRPTLMQNYWTIVVKLHNGHKVIVTMTTVEQESYSWESAISV